MICFYHNADLDGHCSGAIIKCWAERNQLNCVLYGINYGDPFPWDLIKDEHLVVMVDFSLQPFGDMIKLFNMTKGLIWIDHHISAIEDCAKFGFNHISGVRDVNEAACELTWKYFNSAESIPQAVKLLGRYDVWDHTNPDVLPFQYGMRLYNTNPNCGNFNWSEMFSSFPYNILGEGKTILKYIEQDNEKYSKFCYFETSINGKRAIAINRLMGNSQMFSSVWDESKYDVMIAFGIRKGRWTVSLYTTKDDIDVSVIAKSFGGGGHKQASGFQCQDLPFDLKQKEV